MKYCIIISDLYSKFPVGIEGLTIPDILTLKNLEYLSTGQAPSSEGGDLNASGLYGTFANTIDCGRCKDSCVDLEFFLRLHDSHIHISVSMALEGK